jgi:hypothetical protein
MEAAATPSGKNQSEGVFDQVADVTIDNMAIRIIRHWFLLQISTGTILDKHIQPTF